MYYFGGWAKHHEWLKWIMLKQGTSPVEQSYTIKAFIKEWIIIIVISTTVYYYKNYDTIVRVQTSWIRLLVAIRNTKWILAKVICKWIKLYAYEQLLFAMQQKNHYREKKHINIGLWIRNHIKQQHGNSMVEKDPSAVYIFASTTQ